MSTAPTTTEPRLTAEQYAELADSGRLDELVRGRIVPVSRPSVRHGQICFEAGLILAEFVKKNNLGHLVSNDAAIVTERDPDTVRGADIAFYSYNKFPKGPLPSEVRHEVPDLIVEVRSPSERWPMILAKAAEYLAAGVSVVVILDDERRSANVISADGSTRMLADDDELAIPEILGDFHVPIQRFFE